MTFSQSITTVLGKKYAGFSGRASRSEFWWFQLFAGVVVILLTMALAGTVTADYQGVYLSSSEYGDVDVIQEDKSFMIIAAILVLFVLLTIIPATALTVRRYHDINLSGWWYLVLTLFSIVLSYYSALYPDEARHLGRQ